jgi:hypothetical protein
VVGPTCLSAVQFTCTGQNIVFLGWFFDGTEVARYIHHISDEDRLPIPVHYDGDLGPILIVNVTSSLEADDINATSTFTANTSVLEAFSSIQCGTRSVRSDFVMVNVSVLGKYTCWCFV